MFIDETAVSTNFGRAGAGTAAQVTGAVEGLTWTNGLGTTQFTITVTDTAPQIATDHTVSVVGVSLFVRFATTVASDYATLATKRALPLTWAGLPPAGSHQLATGALIQ